MRSHFPFMLHRTLAEVAETERLRCLRTKHMISRNWWGGPRLTELEARATEPERNGEPEGAA